MLLQMIIILLSFSAIPDMSEIEITVDSISNESVCIQFQEFPVQEELVQYYSYSIELTHFGSGYDKVMTFNYTQYRGLINVTLDDLVSGRMYSVRVMPFRNMGNLTEAGHPTKQETFTTSIDYNFLISFYFSYLYKLINAV